MTCAADVRRRKAPWAVILLLAAALREPARAQQAPGEPPATEPSAAATGEDVRGLTVGHWVRIKGRVREPGLFAAEEIEVREPGDQESLIGTVDELASDGTSFMLLGQRVGTSARTTWDGVDYGSLAGTRVEVEGHWRGAGKFSARDITLRKPGRDRIEGRIDAIAPAPDGVELRVLHLRVAVPRETPVASERPLAELPLAPGRPQQDVRQVRDDDDQITGETALTDTLSFGGQLEAKWERRDNYDLDDEVRADRLETSQSLRGELTWEPNEEFFALFGFRESRDVSRREDEPTERDSRGVVTELYGYWRDPLGAGFDVQAGRQDFDEPREWLYDENLDALRLLWQGQGVRLELSESTVLTDGSPKEREYDNQIAYLSNGDWNRHLAAYVIRRTDHEGPEEDEPLHLGLRALGEWLPDQDVWLEASWLRGHGDDGLDRRGFGLDAGTTWSPSAIEPFYLIGGWARGSGDSDPDDDVDETFRQTGMQDNNGKFGGVTSFRYYGEILDPELANLQVSTLGLGVRPDQDVSIDLVWHAFEQPEPAATLVDSSLKEQPDGAHDGLGHELDLVVGWRRGRQWDVELVLGTFDPGPAFPDGDRAFLTSMQVRFRF